METRKSHLTKFSPLPADYMKMVNEVFTTNFDAGLKKLAELSEGKPYFETSGRIYADEIILCVSLMHKGQLAATSVYASADFDSKASSPTIQDLLAACVDAAGAIYGQLLSPDRPEVLEQMANQSLSALENIPFQWTAVQLDRYPIHVKIDKANPNLDQMADEWLSQHDPESKRQRGEEEKETEALFFTGPKKKPGSETTH